MMKCLTFTKNMTNMRNKRLLSYHRMDGNGIPPNPIMPPSLILVLALAITSERMYCNSKEKRK